MMLHCPTVPFPLQYKYDEYHHDLAQNLGLRGLNVRNATEYLALFVLQERKDTRNAHTFAFSHNLAY